MSEDVWTIEELVALTEDVQQGEVEYRGKKFEFQFCEFLIVFYQFMRSVEVSQASPRSRPWFFVDYDNLRSNRLLHCVDIVNITTDSCTRT